MPLLNRTPSGEQDKLDWLLARLPGFIDEGDVLLFAGQRAKVDEVTAALTAAGFKAGAIHGDMDQVNSRVYPWGGLKAHQQLH